MEDGTEPPPLKTNMKIIKTLLSPCQPATPLGIEYGYADAFTVAFCVTWFSYNGVLRHFVVLDWAEV